jgi:hypothetical protein
MQRTQEPPRLSLLLSAPALPLRELGAVPSGHLYANLQGHITIGQFEQAISILKNAGLVRESNAHLLAWIGPEATA